MCQHLFLRSGHLPYFMSLCIWRCVHINALVCAKFSPTVVWWKMICFLVVKLTKLPMDCNYQQPEQTTGRLTFRPLRLPLTYVGIVVRNRSPVAGLLLQLHYIISATHFLIHCVATCRCWCWCWCWCCCWFIFTLTLSFGQHPSSPLAIQSENA